MGRNPWYLTIAAAAVLGLVTGGVAILVQGNGTPSHQATSDCGLISCSANLPGPSATISTQSHISKAHAPVSHSPSAPKKSATPSPTSSQAPAAATAANVTVAFTSDTDQRDSDHFQSQLTLVNHGDSPVSGWTLQLALPGDGIDSVENQGERDGAPFDHWQYSGDTLTISADSGNETLGPGAPLNVSIHGRGNTTSPAGCTFNGAACPTETSGNGQHDQQPGQHSQQPMQQDQQWGQQDQQSGQQNRQSGQQDQQSGQHGQQSGQQNHQRF